MSKVHIIIYYTILYITLYYIQYILYIIYHILCIDDDTDRRLLTIDVQKVPDPIIALLIVHPPPDDSLREWLCHDLDILTAPNTVCSHRWVLLYHILFRDFVKKNNIKSSWGVPSWKACEWRKCILFSRLRILVWYGWTQRWLPTTPKWFMASQSSPMLSHWCRRRSLSTVAALSIASRLYHRGNARFTVRRGRLMLGRAGITISFSPVFL